MTYNPKEEIANNVAEKVGASLLRLHQETGFPLECILAGAHAEVITMMASAVGSRATATCCERAAERLRELPEPTEYPLAFVHPVGEA